MPAEKLPPSSPDVEPTAMAAGDGVASPTEEQDYWVVYRRRRFRRRVYWRRRRVIWRRRYWRRRYYW